MTEERHWEICDLVIADGENRAGPDTHEALAQRIGVPLDEVEEWFARSLQMVKDAEPLREPLRKAFQRLKSST